MGRIVFVELKLLLCQEWLLEREAVRHHSHRRADGCEAICHKRWNNWLTVWTLLLIKDSHFFVT